MTRYVQTEIHKYELIGTNWDMYEEIVCEVYEIENITDY